MHKFPVPQRQSADDQRCSVGNVGGHFNPYGVSISDSPANGTEDQYEVGKDTLSPVKILWLLKISPLSFMLLGKGDLSGKYGKISTAKYSRIFDDWNLPLFGPNSVVGRSIVLHRSDGSR